MKTLLCSVAMIALTATAWAQDAMKFITPDTLTWMIEYGASDGCRKRPLDQ
jgi:hypothetical protein